MTAPLHQPDRRASNPEAGPVSSPQIDLEVRRLAVLGAHRVQAARLRREARRARELTTLLRQRPDLDDLCTYAEFAVTSLRWCV